MTPATNLQYRDFAMITERASLPHPLKMGSDEIYTSWYILVGVVLGVALVMTWLAWRSGRRLGPPANPATPLPQRAWWAALGLFLLALLLRLVGLGQEAGDSQEITYLLQAIVPKEMMGNTSAAWFMTALSPQMVSPHPPLFRLLLFGWLDGGDALAWLRLPAAIAGALTVPALYLWARRDRADLVGVIAGSLLAISPFHIYFSQTVTPYALLGLFAVLAGSLHTRAMQPKGPFFRYTLVLALGFCCHFIFPALVAPLGLHLLWRRWRDPSPLTRYQLWRFSQAVAIGLLPFSLYALGLFFYAPMMEHIMPVMHAMELFETFEGPGQAVGAFMSGWVGFAAHGLSASVASPALALCAIPLLIPLGVGVTRALKERDKAWHITVAAMPFALIIFIMANGVLTVLGNGFHYFASRRFVALTPFLLLLLALGLVTLAERLRARGFRATTSLALVGVLAAFSVGPMAHQLIDHLTTREKPDLPAAVEALDARLQDGDGIAVAPYHFFDFMVGYHARHQMRDWYHAGGPSRWIRWRGDGGPVDVMVTMGDLLLPWTQVLEHGHLKRVWLLEIDERPYGLLELKGPGTIGATPLEAAGFEACEVESSVDVGPWLSLRCFERRPLPPAESRLTVGEQDYRQIIGTVPPGQVRSPVRRLRQGSAFLLADSPDARHLEIEISARLPSRVRRALGLGEHLPVQVTVTRGERRQSYPLNLPLAESVQRLPWEPAPAREGPGPVLVRFEIDPSVEEAAADCFDFQRSRLHRFTWCGLFVERMALTP